MWPIFSAAVLLAGGGIVVATSAILKRHARRRAQEAAEEAAARRRAEVRKAQRQTARRVMDESPVLAAATSFFSRLLTEPSYISRRQWLAWLNQYQPTAERIAGSFETTDLDPTTLQTVLAFNRFMTEGESLIATANRTFVEAELQRYGDLFDKVEKHPLNARQREAIVHDEDANLVIAGAGTGKTSSIVGKVAYLLLTQKARPEEILLLAFTRKAAEEMQERIRLRIGPEAAAVAVRTFHSFGLEVIGQARGTKPDLAFEEGSDFSQYKAIHRQFEALLRGEQYARLAIQYFAYHLQPVLTARSFDSPGDYYRYLKSQKPLHLKGERLSMKGDELRSFEEVDIANFLFINGVNYEYEADYLVPTADATHRPYKADFYLPDYGIYIEHFAVDRDGRVPDWFGPRNGQTASEAYNSDMAWKRQLHRTHGTILIETYSYERREGTLLDNLARRLQEHHVVMKERSAEELIAYLRGQKQSPLPLFVKFMATFLSLAKSNGFSVHDLRKTAYQAGDSVRTRAFLDIFAPVYEGYEQSLRDQGRIDFSDMISQATGHIERREYVSPFRYILIDEFQDMSIGRFKMLQALRRQSEDVRLYCVGDDWQSIYRFTGSDISVMVDFEKHFGFTKTTALNVTYRFGQNLINVSSAFVQKNPTQLRKHLVAHESCHDEAVPCEVRYADVRNGGGDVASILASLEKEAHTAGRKYRVAVLGRYRHDEPSTLLSITRLCPRLDVTFQTVHSAKGLEWDYVILINVVAGKYGFPTEICDDPILELVLTGDRGARNAEERRLFYVALTRARRKVFILTDSNRPSIFVKELEAGSGRMTLCPACKTGFLVERGDGKFKGCDNYPYCAFTFQDGARTCPKCGIGSLVVRYGRHGRFTGCTNRECNHKEKMEQEFCPTVGCLGHIVRRRGQYGAFLGCSNFHKTGCTYKRKIDAQ